jgi:hypothetical protein
MTETPETPGAPETPTGPGGTQPPAPPPPPAQPPATVEAAAEYPVTLDIDRQDQYARFMPLIKWLLAIPHYIVLFFLFIGAAIAIIISWFAVVITRRYPRGLFNYVVGVYRWYYRVGAYVSLMTDRYPPFTLQDQPDYPVDFDIDYPEEGVARWRPFFAGILIIPYAIAAAALLVIAEVVLILVFFTILFAKRFPEGMFNLVVVAFRWVARTNAYQNWLVTKYPPFVWG